MTTGRFTGAVAAVAAALLGPAGAAHGQTAAPHPHPAAAAPGATTVLLDQARYWQQQNQPDRALAALNRALLLDPHNPEALALAVEIHIADGDRAAAAGALAALRAARPADPHIPGLVAALRIGPIDTNGLAAARALAHAGRAAEAVRRYRALFHDGPPTDALAVEYYQVLASTAGGWQAARDGLAGFVTRYPQNIGAQLAYAELLTYRPASRNDGIARLAILARTPSVASAARTAWRQALDWIPVDAGSIPLYRAYLAQHPGDAALEAHLAEAEHPPHSPAEIAGMDRQRGFAALGDNRLADAETAFQAALAINPHDADALGGLGLVRQRQNRDAEARDLLQQAIAAAPGRAGQWQPALDGLTAGLDMAAARQAADAGRLADAVAALRRVIARGGETVGAQALLANVLTRAADLPGAEAAWRAVIATQPDNAGAMLALAGLLRRTGQPAEALALQRRADAIGHTHYAARTEAADRAAALAARAARLRAEAGRTTDPQQAIALYRAAIAAAPADAFTRLALARLLAQEGHAEAGRALLAALTDTPHPSADALHAAALFAREQGHPGQAAALAERIPPARRPADLRAFLAQQAFAAQLRAAIAAAGSGAPARQRLLALAATPDPTGAVGPAIMRALAHAGDPAGAREALARAMQANPNPPSGARLAYAGALLELGRDRASARLADRLDGATDLSPAQRADLARLHDGIDVRNADRLNEAGRTADAYDALAPALRRSPNAPAVQMSLARLYQSAGQPARTLDIAGAVLRADPANADAARTAAGAAMELQQFGTAQAMTDAAMRAAPDDPRNWVVAANLARARNDAGEALADLERARALRRRLPTPPTDDSTFLPAAPDSANPFRHTEDATRTPPAAEQGPLSAQIDHAIANAQEALAPFAQIGAGYRTRSGASGLDGLSEVSVPITLSVAPLNTGRLSLHADTVLLSGGRLSTAPGSRAQFGSLALGGPTPADQQAQGVGLSAEYAYRWLAADIGSSPVGFRITNIVGGAVLTPELTAGVRLRLTAERRAVTDSVLSYAGTVDPRSGASFGGVVRNRIDAQLERSFGRVDLYAHAGYDALDGTRVAGNTEFEAGAGGSTPIWRSRGRELRAGLDLVYFAYGRNLRYFTLGQGGYFSPQSYFAARIPLTYSVTADRLTWSVGASVGFQTYREARSDVFPGDPALQSRLAMLAATTPGTVTAYAAQSQSGPVGGAKGRFEYRIDRAMRVGGEISYEKAGDYDETRAMLTFRYLFGG